MAQSTKGAGNFLFPLAVVTAAVVVAIAVTFTIGSEEPPDEPTVIAEDDVDARPAGAGTVPQGEADETVEGITDQLDEVTPAAPGAETVPPAELATEGDADDQIEGETEAHEDVAGTADEPVVEPVPAEAASDGSAPGDPAGDGEGGGTGTTEAGNETDGEVGTDVTTDEAATENAEAEGFPAGRDAQTELTPEEGQDVVEDTDEGGTAFVPTPSGPEGRDNETIAD